MEEEEPRELQLGDQRELLVEPTAGTASERGVPWVASRKCLLADVSELAVGRFEPLREVRVAIAELLGQVEGQPGRELGGAEDGVPVVGEAVEHLPWREQDALVVA